MTTARTFLAQLFFLHHTAGLHMSLAKQTGASATLEFQQHQQLEKESIDIIQWYFGQDKIMKYVPLRQAITEFSHKGRLEFNKETFSLELKNLQKNDSGLYRGEISAGATEVKAEFSLSVLDPVSTPVLQVTSDTPSSDLCNATLTCRGRDLSLNISCSNRTCWPNACASNDSALALFVRDDVIICNHSNQVSWSNATIKTRTLCDLTDQTEYKRGAEVILPTAILLVGALLVLGALLVHWRRRLKAGRADINTEYATITNGPPAQPTSSTVYHTAQFPSRPISEVESPYAMAAANPIYSSVQQQPQDHTPHTSSPWSLYVTVNKM